MNYTEAKAIVPKRRKKKKKKSEVGTKRVHLL